LGDYRQDNIVYARNSESEYYPAKIRKALFVSLRPIYVTDVIYLEKYSGPEVQVYGVGKVIHK